ncbi:MAG: pyrimidine dimer DNA glycosylase/endonuclease V [archaeon]
MRMWMINPKYLCRKHLMGEHVETHMIVSHINKGKSINGFIKNNLIEPISIKERHDILAIEMVNRKYNHKSKIIQPNIKYLSNYIQNYKIDIIQSSRDLINRCDKCKQRFLEFQKCQHMNTNVKRVDTFLNA